MPKKQDLYGWDNLLLKYSQTKIDYNYAPYIPLNVTDTAVSPPRKKPSMIIEMNKAPNGFNVLMDRPHLYYKVEDDGGVIITGELTKCLFKLELLDDSVIEGGINQNGMLLGDRRFKKDRGKGKSYPLRWFSREAVEKGIMPPLERRRKIELPPGKVIGGKKPHPVGIGADTKALLEQLQNQVASNAREVIDRLEVEIKTKDKAYAALRTKMSQLQQKHAAIMQEVDTYRKSMEKTEREAKAEVEALRVDYQRRHTVRRWQIEAVERKDWEIEGLVANSWEIEDDKGDLRYLVVTQYAKGSGHAVEKQWLTDLKTAMDEHIGEDRIVYVNTPEGCSTTVCELLPSFAEEDDEEVGLF